jgi:hypothetical protein
MIVNKGFTPVSQFKRRPRLVMGIEGLPDTGKTEFALTAPPCIGWLAVDRGFEHVISKEIPPRFRQTDIDLREFQIPLPTQDPTQEGTTFLQVWNEFYTEYKSALANPRYRTIIVDGDSDTWELQQLAAFGKVTQIAPIKRVDVNAARRVMLCRGFDSGKNVIFTYRLKPEYEKTIKFNAAGQPSEVDEKTGDYKRAGWNDQDYIIQVQARALYEKDKKVIVKGQEVECPEPQKYGLRITKCKIQPDLVGFELWGDECNFQSLVQVIFPDDDLADWGYKLL